MWMKLYRYADYALQHAKVQGYRGFYLNYQPQVNLITGDIKGVEVLMRWKDEDGSVVSPAEFIPLMEGHRMIYRAGLWMLHKAFRDSREWLEKKPDFTVSVNISVLQFLEDHFLEDLYRIIEEEAFSCENLIVELTESYAVKNMEIFREKFNDMRSRNIRTALDDFGTGYSSLSYLKSIEIDEVKIDRCFVRQIQNSAYNYQLLRNVIELAHSVHIRVCCEGVEKDEELFSLMELHPDVIQGYLFAEPYEKEKFEALYMKPEVEEYRKRIVQEERFRCLHSDDLQRFYGVLNSNYRQRDILKNTRLGL